MANHGGRGDAAPRNHITETSLSQWSDNFYWTNEVKKANNDIFGNSDFLIHQKEIINATLSEHDIFAVMPIGKSLTYQLPALLGGGLTVVICPMLSLMRDQLAGLRRIGIFAEQYSSVIAYTDQQRILDEMVSYKCRIQVLYVTPESLDLGGGSGAFLINLHRVYGQKRLARLVIDEAHCISQWWESDFRPSYQMLHVLKTRFPTVPFLALTATATTRARNDIIKTLGLVNCIVFMQSINRPKLFYSVIRKTGWDDTLDKIHGITTKYSQQSGIIYCFSKKDCEAVAKALQDRYNTKIDVYHGGIPPAQREDVQQRWNQNQIHVVCATIAFGMGISKSNVRFVIHHTMPFSIDRYFQECGRAGRDGQKSSCTMFYNINDYKKLNGILEKQNDTQRWLHSLHQLRSYCEESIKCRRVSLLAYFDEEFFDWNCNGNCDNCEEYWRKILALE